MVPTNASSALRTEVTTSDTIADDISQYAYKSWDELFGMSRKEVEDYQLKSARRRFDELMPGIAALRDMANQHHLTRINTLNDMVPLLFNHTAHKSYPMSVLENNRFDMLTKWLSRMTTVDVSGIDVSGCTGIDEWMATLEANSTLQMWHTSGTSGKISFFPRTTMEQDAWNRALLHSFEGISGEHGVKLGGKNDPRMPVIYPSLRNGRYTSQRILKFMSEAVAPSPEQCYTLSNGTLSADLVSLSGRIRVAQAKGEVGKMKLSASQKVALKRYMEEQTRRGQETADFFARISDQLRGQRVFLFGQTSYLLPAAREGLARGIRNVFAADSVATMGGGSKDVVLPADYKEQIQSFTGISHWYLSYAMTELTGPMPACPLGYYHVPPYIVPFMLDPESGSELPRNGTQTGRFAAFDLMAQTYWGGIMTGDMVTVEWDRDCGCGRKGTHIHNAISRYSTNVTGDDKITCAATVDNTDAALQKLLAV